MSVVADSTMEADALSTALMILGPEAGLAFAHERQVAAHFIMRTGQGQGLTETHTPAFEPYLVT